MGSIPYTLSRTLFPACRSQWCVYGGNGGIGRREKVETVPCTNALTMQGDYTSNGGKNATVPTQSSILFGGERATGGRKNYSMSVTRQILAFPTGTSSLQTNSKIMTAKMNGKNSMKQTVENISRRFLSFDTAHVIVVYNYESISKKDSHVSIPQDRCA